MSKNKGNPVTITVSTGDLVSEEWDQQVAEWADRAEKSRELVSAMSDERRQEAAWIFMKSVGHLLERIDEWFPSAIELKDGSYLDVSVRIATMFIDDEVERSEIEFQKKVEQAKTELAKNIREKAGRGPNR